MTFSSHSNLLHQPLKNTILSLLRTTKNISQLHQIHSLLITTNLFSDPFVAAQLLDSATSNMAYAEIVFTQMHNPNTFSWNTMVKSYVSTANPHKSLHIYTDMRRNGLFGDNYTYPFVLKACGMICGLREGRLVHGEVVKGGFDLDLFVRSGLIGMYCKCGDVGSAKSLFDGYKGKDLVCWNLMLGGYVGCRDMVNAQKVFDEMPQRDVCSWSIMIDGYGKV